MTERFGLLIPLLNRHLLFASIIKHGPFPTHLHLSLR
jgi:hypothetical protein